MSTQNANKGWQTTQINKTKATVMKEGSTDKQRDKDNRYNNYIIAIDKLRTIDTENREQILTKRTARKKYSFGE